jgi:hypothetical protein
MYLYLCKVKFEIIIKKCLIILKISDMEKKEIKKPTTEEIELWTLTQNGLLHMVSYCVWDKFINQCVTEEQKAKLEAQGNKYHQKAYSLTDDMEENNRIIAKYSPWIKGDKVTLEFLLNDEI